MRKAVTSFLLSRISGRKQYLFSVVSVCSTTGICLLFPVSIDASIIGFLLLLNVSVMAMVLDIFPVLLSAVLSALSWDFFFLPPRWHFSVMQEENKLLLAMYFVVALVNAVFTFKIRQIQKEVREKEERTKTLKLYNTLLNSLSHEFRTPIAAIVGASDSLLEHPTRLSGDDSRKLLEEISFASLRLNRLVENLLNMSRLESGFIEPKRDWHDMHEMALSLKQQLKESLGARMMVVGIHPNFPPVRLDHGLIERALYNLLYNACLHTPETTIIRVSAECKGELLLLTVEDNGPGFPVDEIDRAFDKFYRMTNTHAGGTGLGLSIVKGFIEAHNGAIVLSNLSSGGAHFVITLPGCLPSKEDAPKFFTYQLSVS